MTKKKVKKSIPIGDNLDGERHILKLTDSRYIQILIFLTISAFFLRFYNLGFNSLWLDEASTNMVALKSFSEIWQIMVAGEFNPPLFYWMEHIIVMIFGNSEFALRFLPAIFGIATIPLIYLVGTEFRNKNVGIIAASIFAFSPFLIIYSQEARAYSAMLFFITASLVFYFKALKTNDIKQWILFGVLSALALWSHFYAFVMIASCMIYALMMHLKDIKQDINYIKPFIVSTLIFGILSLPLFVVIIDLFAKRTSTAPTYGIQGTGVIWETFIQISGYSDLLMYIFMLLFALGVVQAFFVDKERATFLIWSVISVFIVSYFLSFKIPMIPRYLQFLTIIFFIGIAMSYRMFYTIKPSRGVIYGMIIFFMILSVPFSMNYYSQESKTDWRGFSQILEKNTKPGDYVVYVPAYLFLPTEYYYSNKTDGTITYQVTTGKDLDIIQKNGNSIYYVMTGDALASDPTGSSRDWLQKNTKLINQHGEIYLFVR